jgi:hypothetical protein
MRLKSGQTEHIRRGKQPETLTDVAGRAIPTSSACRHDLGQLHLHRNARLQLCDAQEAECAGVKR